MQLETPDLTPTLEQASDKWSPAQPGRARLSAGTVYFLAGASWIANLEAELLAFPAGTNDDPVDAVAYGAFEMQKGKTEPTGSMTAEFL